MQEAYEIIDIETGRTIKEALNLSTATSWLEQLTKNGLYVTLVRVTQETAG